MMDLQKRKAFRSKKYLKWVKTLDCAMCGIEDSSDPHHMIATQMGGMGTKAPDSACMPLCRRCHRALHDTPDHWALQWEMTVKTLMKAIDEGIFIEN